MPRQHRSHEEGVACVVGEVHRRETMAPSAAQIEAAARKRVPSDGCDDREIDRIAADVRRDLAPGNFGADVPAAKAAAPAPAPTSTPVAKRHTLRVDIVEPHRIKMTISPNPNYRPEK